MTLNSYFYGMNDGESGHERPRVFEGCRAKGTVWWGTLTELEVEDVKREKESK
jgi:hypothetical protein